MGVVKELASFTPQVAVTHPECPTACPVCFGPFHLPAMLNAQETLPSVTIPSAPNEFMKVDHAEDHS